MGGERAGRCGAREAEQREGRWQLPTFQVQFVDLFFFLLALLMKRNAVVDSLEFVIMAAKCIFPSLATRARVTRCCKDPLAREATLGKQAAEWGGIGVETVSTLSSIAEWKAPPIRRHIIRPESSK